MMAVSVPSCPGSPAFPLQPASRQETALSSGRKAGRVGLRACASTGADRKHVRVRSWRRKPDVHKEGGRENQPSGSRRRPASQEVTPSHSPGRSWGGRGGRHTQWEPRWAIEAVSQPGERIRLDKRHNPRRSRNRLGGGGEAGETWEVD